MRIVLPPNLSLPGQCLSHKAARSVPLESLESLESLDSVVIGVFSRYSQRLLESHWIRECWPPQFRVGKLCAIFCSSKNMWSLESLEFEEHVVIAQWTFAMARSPIVDSRSVV